MIYTILQLPVGDYEIIFKTTFMITLDCPRIMYLWIY